MESRGPPPLLFSRAELSDLDVDDLPVHYALLYQVDLELDRFRGMSIPQNLAVTAQWLESSEIEGDLIISRLLAAEDCQKHQLKRTPSGTVRSFQQIRNTTFCLPDIDFNLGSRDLVLCTISLSSSPALLSFSEAMQRNCEWHVGHWKL